MKFNKNLFLKLPFQLRPFRVGLVYMISIIVTILFFIEIRLSEHFIDSVLGDVESVLFGSSIFILALVVIIKFIQFFLSSVARFTLIDIENEIKTYFEEKILGKYTRLKYELLRNKQIQENKHTLNKLGERSWQLQKGHRKQLLLF